MTASLLVQVFVLLLAAHAICDYPLQGDWLSRAKNPTLHLVDGETIWPLALGSHALIHSVAAGALTGSWIVCGVEFVLHFTIDYLKCRRAFGYNADQLLHIACKAGYVVAMLIVGGRLP